MLEHIARGPAAAALFLWWCAAAPAVQANDLQFTGYATDRAGKALYTEAHHVQSAGALGESRVVMYRCPQGGAAFARKELTYGKQRSTPEFTLSDARGGYQEGLRQTPQGPRVFLRDSARSPRREAALPANAALVADAGFDEFVLQHWDELEAGKTVRFLFLVPSRLDYLSFKVKKHAETTLEGATVSVIRLNLSGVLGWFLPYIEVAYRKSDRTLKRFDGVTNIRDEAGRNLVAVIDFPYRERRTMPAVDLAKLRAEPLVARC